MNFTKLTDYIDSLEKRYKIPSADVAIYHDGKNVYRHMAGYSDAAKTKPMRGNEEFFLYSTTKVITVTAAMILIEEGKLSLEDEAGKFYSAFEEMYIDTPKGLKKAEKKLTVKSLLTMTGGLNYNLDSEPLRAFKVKASHENIMEEAMEAIAKMSLSFEPSTHYQYSLCHDVIGGIIEKVSGMKFGEFLRTRIFEPLGMTRTRFSLDETKNPLFLEQYIYEPLQGENRILAKTCPFSMIEGYEGGGAGLVSCVDDYIKFAAMLADGGITKKGDRILSRSTIDLMRTPALDEVCLKDYGKYEMGYSYGLGVRTMVDREKKGAKSPIGEFGWDGAAGAYTFIDVDNDLALFYAQHVRNSSAAGNTIHPKLRDLTYECIGL